MEHEYVTPELLQLQLSDSSTTPEQVPFPPVHLQLIQDPRAPFSTSRPSHRTAATASEGQLNPLINFHIKLSSMPRADCLWQIPSPCKEKGGMFYHLGNEKLERRPSRGICGLSRGTGTDTHTQLGNTRLRTSSQIKIFRQLKNWLTTTPIFTIKDITFDSLTTNNSAS